MARLLAESLVNLHPARFDSVTGSQCSANVMSPDISGETVIAIIGHSDRVRLLAPRDGHENRTENFLARQPPVTGGFGKDNREREISLAQRSLFRGQAAKNQLPSLRCIPSSILGASPF
jgi:hypothetical protein